MIFDWTVGVGNILAAFTVIAGAWGAMYRIYALFDKRITLFESVLHEHARILNTQGLRIEKQDDILVKLAGDIREVLGRLSRIP